MPHAAKKIKEMSLTKNASLKELFGDAAGAALGIMRWEKSHPDFLAYLDA